MTAPLPPPGELIVEADMMANWLLASTQPGAKSLLVLASTGTGIVARVENDPLVRRMVDARWRALYPEGSVRGMSPSLVGDLIPLDPPKSGYAPDFVWNLFGGQIIFNVLLSPYERRRIAVWADGWRERGHEISLPMTRFSGFGAARKVLDVQATVVPDSPGWGLTPAYTRFFITPLQDRDLATADTGYILQAVQAAPIVASRDATYRIDSNPVTPSGYDRAFAGRLVTRFTEYTDVKMKPTNVDPTTFYVYGFVVATQLVDTTGQDRQAPASYARMQSEIDGFRIYNQFAPYFTGTMRLDQRDAERLAVWTDTHREEGTMAGLGSFGVAPTWDPETVKTLPLGLLNVDGRLGKITLIADGGPGPTTRTWAMIEMDVPVPRWQAHNPVKDEHGYTYLLVVRDLYPQLHTAAGGGLRGRLRAQHPRVVCEGVPQIAFDVTDDQARMVEGWLYS